MEQNNSAAVVKPQKAVQRSHAYPSYTIENCIETVKKIYSELGNSSYHERETIAKILGLSETTIQMQISSCVQYNLLESKSKAGYKITPLFTKIYKPLDEDEKHSALLECFKNPKLYEGLIQEFNGVIVPSTIGLSTILYRKHSIAEAASEKAADIFWENLKFLKIIDDENVLNLNLALKKQSNSIAKIEESDFEKNDNNDASFEAISSNKPTIIANINKPIGEDNDDAIFLKNEAPDALPIYIPLKGGRKAKLVIPENITNEDLNKITRFIEALRED